jgi:hypothetical protein
LINLIALITMILDHIGLVFFPNMIIFRIIGRLSFPLFAYGIARGYKLTRNFKKYAARLILLALFSQYPYYLLLKNGNLNIGFTLATGLFVLRIYESSLQYYIKWPTIIVMVALAQIFRFEYGFYGILTILIFHCFWGKERVIYYQFVLTLVSILILRYDPMELIATFSPILILLINLLIKKDIKLNKILRYGFYPIHLLIFFLIRNGGF